MSVQANQQSVSKMDPSGNSSGGYFKFVKDLEPNQKNISLHVIVLDVAKPTQTKDGHEVRSVRIADKTGSINLSVWNEYGAVLREGDILRLNGCFTQIWKISLQVKVSNKGQIIKVGEFMMVFNELPDMSILSNELVKGILIFS
jgi:ssDNA-binding replication factor A large subunit